MEATVCRKLVPDAARPAPAVALTRVCNARDMAPPLISLLDTTELPSLDRSAAWYRRAGLTDADIATAYSFRHPLARACHLGARLLVRSSLSTLSECAPQQLVFGRGEFGKPEIRGPAGAMDWHFNLSHGGSLVACAIARYPIGIDVEPCQRAIEPLPIARSYFAAAETAWIAADPHRTRDRFLALWTLKEAYLKARGIGLSVPLSTIVLKPVASRGFQAHATDDHKSSWHCRLRRLACGHWLSFATPFPVATPRMTWWKVTPGARAQLRSQA